MTAEMNWIEKVRYLAKLRQALYLSRLEKVEPLYKPEKTILKKLKEEGFVELIQKWDERGEEYLIDISVGGIPQWEVEELEKLTQTYSWLSKSYIEFIKEFDIIGIAMTSFYRFNKCASKPEATFFKGIEYFKPILKDEYFPFALDADGSLFAISKTGEIYRFDKQYSFHQKEKCANSFEEFIGECLLGKRYHEFDDIENNTYYDLLKVLGWV